MKHLSVAIIFWLSIWTAPRAEGWLFRALVIAWGFYLCLRVLNQTNNEKGQR